MDENYSWNEDEKDGEENAPANRPSWHDVFEEAGRGSADPYGRDETDRYRMMGNGGSGGGFVSGVVVCLLLILVAVGGMALGRSIASKQSGTAQMGQTIGNSTSSDSAHLSDSFVPELETIYQYIDWYFLYDYDIKDLQDGMMTGLLDALGDPYSTYYNETALDSFNATTTGEYYGIGCSVSQSTITGIITVVQAYEGAPAAEAGIRAGDIIYAVNDEPVTGVDLDTVVAMIKGAEGTSVNLTVIRDGEDDYLSFDVERRQVTITTVEHEMLDDSIGYIAVSSFEGVTADQFEEAYEDLASQGMQGLVIDMRDNGGGLLSTVEEMLDYLLPEGVIFYAKDKDGYKYLEYSSDEEAALDVPLAILVNGNTASAAEVFSGNLQEFGLGTLVGTTTFGKGIMQNTFYTNSSQTHAIKLTVADYYIHNDRNIHGIGITPDVVVEPDEGEDAADSQLQEAVRIVREQLP